MRSKLVARPNLFKKIVAIAINFLHVNLNIFKFPLAPTCKDYIVTQCMYVLVKHTTVRFLHFSYENSDLSFGDI